LANCSLAFWGVLKNTFSRCALMVSQGKWNAQLTPPFGDGSVVWNAKFEYSATSRA
jgi:hypothetical protein